MCKNLITLDRNIKKHRPIARLYRLEYDLGNNSISRESVDFVGKITLNKGFWVIHAEVREKASSKFWI